MPGGGGVIMTVRQCSYYLLFMLYGILLSNTIDKLGLACLTAPELLCRGVGGDVGNKLYRRMQFNCQYLFQDLQAWEFL